MFATLILLSAVVADLKELRYVRPQGDKFVLESHIAIKESETGQQFTSKTHRGKQVLTLIINREKTGRFLDAEIINDIDGKKTTGELKRKGEVFQLTRNGVTEDIKVAADAIITSAPDWSDILELARRYDLAKKGKQEFAGLWIHPTQKTLTPTFTMELKGSATVKVKGKNVMLNRFESRIRASTNRVWALPEGGVVVKILPAGDKATPIILEGYEEATRDLK